MKTKYSILFACIVLIATGDMSADILPLFYHAHFVTYNATEKKQEKNGQKKKNWRFVLSAREMRITGDPSGSAIFISLQSEKKKYSVKKWTVIVYQEKDSQKQIIRSFSGSDIIPSTIQWNGRDYADAITPPGVYCIQAVVIDGSGNSILFSPEKIAVLP